MPLEIELTTAIDSATAAAGDRFSGKVAQAVRDGSRTLIPERAAVAGRLTQVAVHMQPAQVAIGLHVETVTLDGASVPIHLAGRFVPKGGWLREWLGSLTIGAGGGGGGGGAGGGARGPMASRSAVPRRNRYVELPWDAQDPRPRLQDRMGDGGTVTARRGKGLRASS